MRVKCEEERWKEEKDIEKQQEEEADERAEVGEEKEAKNRNGNQSEGEESKAVSRTIKDEELDDAVEEEGDVAELVDDMKTKKQSW